MIKVFMAEDDSLLVNVYERMFRAKGYEIIFGKDGEDTIYKLKNMEIKPSVIFLDIIMPKMSGFDVIKELKSDEKLKNIPVIFLTNLYQEEDEKMGMSLGAVAYLVKSKYVPSEIVDKMKEICDKNCVK